MKGPVEIFKKFIDGTKDTAFLLCFHWLSSPRQCLTVRSSSGMAEDWQARRKELNQMDEAIDFMTDAMV